MQRWRAAVKILAVMAVLEVGTVTALLWLFPNPPWQRAIIGMGAATGVIWCAIGGGLQWRFRPFWVGLLHRAPGPWEVRFVAACTALALLEEVVTVSMTNAAPLFGVKVGEAYITASANYLDVVALHSVVVFVPMFVAWAWLLRKWSFHPIQVFFLFGLTGAIAEMSFGGWTTVFNAFWYFVYGLMIWIPAHLAPVNPNQKAPRFRHFVLAVLVPFVFAMPVAGIVGNLHPYPVHFPQRGSDQSRSSDIPR